MLGSTFIPEFHLIPSADKMNPIWCKRAVDYYWYNTNIKSLLWDKKIELIEEFFTGDIKMERFMSMFKSIRRKYDEKMRANGRYLIGDYDIDQDLRDIIFQAYPQIQNKVNSVIALTQKIPIEITCTAIDALAVKKKNEDVQFIKNKPVIEAELQEISDELGVSTPDIGTTSYSSTKYGGNPFGFDLNNPDDKKTFVDLVYALNVETSLEQALEIFKDLKNARQIKLLETKDQVKYSISCNEAFVSAMTGLPDAEYVWPGDVLVGYSDLPDYSDRDERFRVKNMSITDMFNRFGNEICGVKELEEIINGIDGYCKSNSLDTIDNRNFNTAKVRLVRCYIRSIDWVGVYKNPKSNLASATLTYDESKCTDKIWGQNTYCFWWLQNTKYFFDITKLGYAHRTRGLESYQNFPLSIYKSNNKSAVELSIGQNIKSQIAEIKINFAVLMAKADGFYIDIRGMRNAALTLKDADYTAQKLMDLFTEKNIIIADTEGFEGKNDGQFKPMIPIEGGVKNILSYIQVQQTADQKTDRIFGTNESLTGASQNPDALIGVEKLRIDASINALYYITEALEVQQQKMYSIWGSAIQQSIKMGGATKKAMIDFLGIDDVNLLEGLNDTPIHNLTIKVSLTQREQERAEFRQNLNLLIAKGAITLTDQYVLSAITNPKSKFAELAKIENRWKIQQEKLQQQQFEQAQQLQDQRNEGVVAGKNADTEGAIKKVYAQGDVQAKILQLSSQLGLNAQQTDFLIKRALQSDRGQDQYRKAIAQVNAKNESKLVEPLAIT